MKTIHRRFDYIASGTGSKGFMHVSSLLRMGITITFVKGESAFVIFVTSIPLMPLQPDIGIPLSATYAGCLLDCQYRGSFPSSQGHANGGK
jgi:hypothetical protein